MPGVESSAQGQIVGSVSLTDLLNARVYYLDAMTQREQILRLPQIQARKPAQEGAAEVYDEDGK